MYIKGEERELEIRSYGKIYEKRCRTAGMQYIINTNKTIPAVCKIAKPFGCKKLCFNSGHERIDN